MPIGGIWSSWTAAEAKRCGRVDGSVSYGRRPERAPALRRNRGRRRTLLAAAGRFTSGGGRMEFKFEHNTLPGSLELAYLGDTHLRPLRPHPAGRRGRPRRRDAPPRGVARLRACAVRGVSARGGCAQRRGGGGCPARAAMCISRRPRHADAAEYHRATALEALIGYLYVTGQRGRMEELLARALPPEEIAAGGGRLTRGRALAPGAGRLSLDGRRSFRIVTGKLGLDANSRRRSFAVSSRGFPVWRGQSREFFDESDGKPRNCGHFRLRRYRANPARESSRRSAAWIEQTSIARRGSRGMERIRRQA